MNLSVRNLAIKEFQQIPGIGPRLASKLAELGYSGIKDLKGEDPESMYTRLCALYRQPIDRCVLYVFRSAVAYAKRKHSKDWWEFKD